MDRESTPAAPPTREQYDAAKARQEADPEAFSANNPSEEVLADVSAIRRFEHAENRRLYPDLPHDPAEEVGAP